MNNSIWITRIEESRNRRYKVFSDDRFLFALYGSELKKYNINENSEMDVSLYTELIESVIRKRAKERALYLLERRPYSEYMLRTKLKETDYPENVIENVVGFLKKYHYLDDYMYVSMYVEAYGSKKSKKKLIFDLKQKGIRSDIIHNYFEEQEFCDDEQLMHQLEHYVNGKDLMDYKVQQKVIRYFYGKGFAYSLITECIQKIVSSTSE
ncbi:MAG: regulatory protein RecX [Eubacteriales bacterium]|nr:regulatory protein RecX [Eubacteriales bacterium]